MKVTPALKEELADWLNTYWTTYLKGDIETWATFIRDDYRNIGGTKEEIWNSKQEIINYTNSIMDQMLGTVDIRNRKVELIPYGEYMMVHEFTDLFVKVEGEWTFYGPFRMSSLLEKADAGWIALHQHGSYPDMKAMQGEAFSIDALKAENAKLQAAVKSRTIELEIETALEKVRAEAMGMNKPDDILAICKVMFKELQTLGFPQLRNTLINFWDDEHSSLVDYDYSDETGGHKAILSYSSHPVFEQFQQKIKNSQDAFAELVVTKDELESWKQRRRDSGEYEDPRLNNIAALYYYFYSIEVGAIGISTFSPITEEQLNVLRRFRNVFDFAYRRYADVAQAEAQAREAEIELALERVRARTMAMQRSEELVDVATVLFQQVKGLGVPQWNCGFNIWNIGDKEFTYYPGSPDGIISPSPCKIPLTEHPVFKRFDESRRRGEELLVYEKEGEEQADHYRYMLSLPGVGDLLQSMLDAGFELPKFQIDHLANFAYGNLIFITYEHFPKMLDVFKRFAKVFEQTYTRFLDLQKAEAQARESKIEAALEKARARTMGMQSSDELPEVANVLFLEVQGLGIPAWSCGYNILAADKTSATCCMSSEGTLQTPFKLRLFGEASFAEMGDFLRSEQTMLVQELGGNALEEHYAFMKSFPDLKPTFDQIDELGLSLPTYQINHLCKFTQGFLLFITYEKVPDSHDIFKRFTKVFEQTYTRFLDLKKAESQARQAKIETALEKVRARALAMQEPEELIEVAEVLRHEMGLLGVEELETCSIFIHDETINRTECWYALKDSRSEEKKLVSDHFPLQLHDTWVGREMEKFYSSDSKQVSIVMQGANRKQWINYCEEQSISLQGYYGETIPDRTYHLYKFSHGAIGAASAGDISSESWDLLQRAASVFSLAYSRFKDLTQARFDLQRLKEEKQKAETALSELQTTQKQLIQSEKMASLGELTAGIAHEIQNPLNFVNNFSEVSREMLDEMREAFEKGDTEEAKEIMQDVIQNLEKINHHGKRADGIVKGMLQHSRTSSGAKEPTDINALADEYLRLAYHGLRAKEKSFNATLKTDFDDSIGNINIIPQDIGRVILNLITNAFYVVNEKSKQNIADYEPTVEVSTKRVNSKIEISVKDNGNGIPDSIKEKIFQPFFTTKPTGQGTGLGLSLSYDIVKAHGGELKVETKEAVGSSFIIHLPAKEN